MKDLFFSFGPFSHQLHCVINSEFWESEHAFKELFSGGDVGLSDLACQLANSKHSIIGRALKLNSG